MSRTTRQQAADHIGASIYDDHIVYYADETRMWYAGPVEDLDDLAALLDDTDEDIRRDAYSHWCAGTLHDAYLTADEAASQQREVEVLGLGDEEWDRDEWERYGTVTVRLGGEEGREYDVGVSLGVPAYDRGSVTASGSWRPYLSAWYQEQSDWSAVGVPAEYAMPVQDAIRERAARLWQALPEMDNA